MASGESHACSHAWVRSWKCSAEGATVAIASIVSERPAGSSPPVDGGRWTVDRAGIRTACPVLCPLSSVLCALCTVHCAPGPAATPEPYACESAACAAATRAIGTRYGEQLT